MYFGIFTVSIIFLVFRGWILNAGTFASGDWPYLFKETIQSFSFSPNPSFLWLGPYYQITSKLFVEYFHIPWEITERVMWFWMFLVISFSSSWYLSKVVLNEQKLNFLSVLIFLTNTYILMVVGGGQMGVALSYSLAPFVIGVFISYLRNFSIKQLLIASSVLSLQVMFDPRIACVTGFGILIYGAISLVAIKKIKLLLYHMLIYFLTSGVVVFISNSYWILTQVFSKTTSDLSFSLNSSSEVLRFFSFGSFSQALSLLHPNWPENIFGKTYFLRPEFLILPLIAFTGLLFMERKSLESKKDLVFFALLGLLGVFLAKGAQPPFGEINTWFFQVIPGMSMFRDPTKFYVLIILSYSILIPYSLKHISQKLLRKDIAYVFFIIVWIYLIRQALFGQLSGTFAPKNVPQDYVLLKDFINNDKTNSGTLWIPTRSPFSFYSTSHPVFDSSTLFGSLTSSAILNLYNNEKVKEQLEKEKIKYVIVPSDIEGKIFLNDRKYDEEEYLATVINLMNLPFLHHIYSFGKIVVFKVE